MTTIIIESNNVQARHFIEYARNLPFTQVLETEKKSFVEAVIECDGRPASEFFDELRYQVKEHYKNV
jgi:hypothetical protein